MDGQASLAIGRKGKGTMKFSLKEKIEYVLQYNRGEIIKTPDGAKCRHSFMSSLRTWAKRYNEEGEAGLRRRKNKTCTEEEKKAIVRRILNGERNVDIAKETGISTGAIANWCRKYSNANENQVKCNTKEDTDMPEKKKPDSAETAEQKAMRLEAENEQLRAEIAVLKKSIALKVMKARQQRNRR